MYEKGAAGARNGQSPRGTDNYEPQRKAPPRTNRGGAMRLVQDSGTGREEALETLLGYVQSRSLITRFPDEAWGHDN